MLDRITEVTPRPGYRVWVRFEDGVEGEVDLSHLVGKGVFRRWADDPSEFAAVVIDEASGTLSWPGGLDVAPDALYQRVLQGPGAKPIRIPGLGAGKWGDLVDHINDPLPEDIQKYFDGEGEDEF